MIGCGADQGIDLGVVENFEKVDDALRFDANFILELVDRTDSPPLIDIAQVFDRYARHLPEVQGKGLSAAEPHDTNPHWLEITGIGGIRLSGVGESVCRGR